MSLATILVRSEYSIVTVESKAQWEVTYPDTLGPRGVRIPDK